MVLGVNSNDWFYVIVVLAITICFVLWLHKEDAK